MNQVKYTQETIDALKREAATNKAFNAVCHVFALRKRTRAMVTIHGLTLAMTSEGFHYSKKEYQRILSFLSRLNIGKLEVDKQGNSKALTNITVTLQSIGKAAVGNVTELKTKAKTPNKFFELADKTIREPVNVTKKVVLPSTPNEYPAFLTVMIEGQPVVFRIPANFTQDVATLIEDKTKDQDM